MRKSEYISMCLFFRGEIQSDPADIFSDNSAVKEKIIKNIIEMTETNILFL